MKTKVFQNHDIIRVVLGVPQGHQHIRTIIETEHERFIFQEATIANIVRAYITQMTHPLQLGVELILKEIDGKEGYARYQLLESLKTSMQIQIEMTHYLEKSSNSQ